MPLVDLATSSLFCSQIIREKILVFEDVRESPVEGVFEGTFACEVEAAKSTITGISKSGSQYNDEELTL